MIVYILFLVISFKNMDSVVIKTPYKMDIYDGNLKEKLLTTPVYAAFEALVDTSCDHTNVVVGVSNNHMAGMQTYNVEMIYFKGLQKIPRVPSGLEHFYPNLLTFRIPFCELEDISSEELRYPRLKHAYLSYNKLKKLDGDLFKHTPLLEFLGVENNNIRTVGWFIFDHLSNLNIVYTGNVTNMCVDFWARNRSEVLDVMKRFLLYCNPPV